MEKPQTRRRKSLSDKQLAILEVIQTSIARHGYPPSMREIGDAVGLKSLSSVTHQLGQLELSGYLRRDAGKTRAMEVLIDLPGLRREPRRQRPRSATPRSCRSWVGSPPACRSRRPAGRGDLPAPPSARGQGRPVHAQGERRVDDRRRDLRRRLGRRALAGDRDNGDIVAAMLDGEATVKTFRQRDGHTWLLPRNTAFEPILGDDATVLGKVVAVLARSEPRRRSRVARGSQRSHRRASVLVPSRSSA
jgi:repressor LexA